MNRHLHEHGGLQRQQEGVSSFDIIDAPLVFRELKLRKGDVFLDLGCGAGDFSLYAAGIVGDSGTVYAVDRWKEAVSNVAGKAANKGLHNINAVVADITTALLPLENKSVDVCLLAQVLHGFDGLADAKNLFAELCRVLKPGGKTAVIEIKKENSAFGPPIEKRLLPQKIEEVLAGFGFSKEGLIDLGCCYMIVFLAR